MIVEFHIVMLVCGRIGAVHSVVFAGFFSESLAQRIIDKPKNIITCHAVRRGSKTIYLEDIVDAAVAESSSNDKKFVKPCYVPGPCYFTLLPSFCFFHQIYHLQMGMTLQGNTMRVME
ncbi:acetyl-coenzyme A synthetase, chloroplastic/glyoxysomal-like [Primulina tabacum]|uniref:acetyl-coenzyme A synthetase, chloroplastic/glyoxysomal-like n=1 Tax=Primulina tabacum TaxID=48773 RepID=UPI003F59FC6A